MGDNRALVTVFGVTHVIGAAVARHLAQEFRVRGAAYDVNSEITTQLQSEGMSKGVLLKMVNNIIENALSKKYQYLQVLPGRPSTNRARRS